MPQFSPESRKEFMLAAMRRAIASLRASALEIEEVGTSLKLGMIDAEQAAVWLDHIGALRTIEPPALPGSVEVA